MLDFSMKGIAWLEKNYAAVLTKCLLRHKKVRWGGTFKTGAPVPVGTVVVRDRKLYLAVSKDQASLPSPNAKGFHLLVDLKTSLEGDPLNVPDLDISGKPNSREHALVLAAVRYTIKRFDQKVRDSSISGTNLWRGVFKSGESYSSGDMVTYDGNVYEAKSGKGVPTHTSGWTQLSLRRAY